MFGNKQPWPPVFWQGSLIRCQAQRKNHEARDVPSDNISTGQTLKKAIPLNQQILRFMDITCLINLHTQILQQHNPYFPAWCTPCDWQKETTFLRSKNSSHQACPSFPGHVTGSRTFFFFFSCPMALDWICLLISYKQYHSYGTSLNIVCLVVVNATTWHSCQLYQRNWYGLQISLSVCLIGFFSNSQQLRTAATWWWLRHSSILAAAWATIFWLDRVTIRQHRRCGLVAHDFATTCWLNSATTWWLPP